MAGNNEKTFQDKLSQTIYSIKWRFNAEEKQSAVLTPFHTMFFWLLILSVILFDFTVWSNIRKITVCVCWQGFTGDEESLFFRDGRRRIDFVLVYQTGTKAAAIEHKRAEKRVIFERSMRKEGIEIETSVQAVSITQNNLEHFSCFIAYTLYPDSGRRSRSSAVLCKITREMGPAHPLCGHYEASDATEGTVLN